MRASSVTGAPLPLRVAARRVALVFSSVRWCDTELGPHRVDVADGGDGVALGDDEIELVATVGERVDERLAEGDEARPVEHVRAEHGRLEGAADGVERRQ